MRVRNFPRFLHVFPWLTLAPEIAEMVIAIARKRFEAQAATAAAEAEKRAEEEAAVAWAAAVALKQQEEAAAAEALEQQQVVLIPLNVTPRLFNVDSETRRPGRGC
jgi:hypothetical protein